MISLPIALCRSTKRYIHGRLCEATHVKPLHYQRLYSRHTRRHHYSLWICRPVYHPPYRQPPALHDKHCLQEHGVLSQCYESQYYTLLDSLLRLLLVSRYQGSNSQKTIHQVRSTVRLSAMATDSSTAFQWPTTDGVFRPLAKLFFVLWLFRSGIIFSPLLSGNYSVQGLRRTARDKLKGRPVSGPCRFHHLSPPWAVNAHSRSGTEIRSNASRCNDAD